MQQNLLSFNIKGGETTKTIRMSSPKIGWIRSLSNKSGARFDIVFKDSLGRVRLEKINCGNETDQYGELINHPTLIGEEIEVSLKNVKGADKIDLFVD